MLVKQNIHFFEQSIQPRIPASSKVSLSLVKAEVGTNKEKLDIVDLNLAIAPVLHLEDKFNDVEIRDHACED